MRKTSFSTPFSYMAVEEQRREEQNKRKARRVEKQRPLPLTSYKITGWEQIGHSKWGDVCLEHVPTWVQKAFENIGTTLEEGSVSERIRGHHFEYLVMRYVYGQGGMYSDSVYYRRPLRS